MFYLVPLVTRKGQQTAHLLSVPQASLLSRQLTSPDQHEFHLQVAFNTILKSELGHQGRAAAALRKDLPSLGEAQYLGKISVIKR